MVIFSISIERLSTLIDSPNRPIHLINHFHSILVSNWWEEKRTKTPAFLFWFVSLRDFVDVASDVSIELSDLPNLDAQLIRNSSPDVSPAVNRIEKAIPLIEASFILNRHRRRKKRRDLSFSFLFLYGQEIEQSSPAEQFVSFSVLLLMSFILI